MSLRAFHLFFIAVSTILAAFVAAWAAQQYQATQAISDAAVSAGALVSGIGMAIYGAMFQRKTRNLSGTANPGAATKARKHEAYFSFFVSSCLRG